MGKAWQYGSLRQESWTLEDYRGRVSCNFGLWNDYLRITVAVFQRMVALDWAFGCVLGNSLGFCPIHWPIGRDRRPELLIETLIEAEKSRTMQVLRLMKSTRERLVVRYSSPCEACLCQDHESFTTVRGSYNRVLQPIRPHPLAPVTFDP